MKPIHILAKPENIAERVLLAGDPGRVKKLSGLLDRPMLANRNRGFLVYTGEYGGARISMATHGIGAPSAAIVVEELAMLGARTFIRYGSSGSMSPDLQLGDFVIATEASATPGGLYSQYFDGKGDSEPTADASLVNRLKGAFEARKLNYRAGKVFSTDAFYAADDIEKFAKRHYSDGNIAIEMECAMLYRLSRLRGWRSASALIISDTLLGGVKWLSPAQINKRAMEGAEAVLDALAK